MDTMLPSMQDEVQSTVCVECGCAEDRHTPSCPYRIVESPDKRVVLIVTDGLLTGLHQICGRVEGKDVPRLDPFLPEVHYPDGHVSGASMIRVDARAVYYRELILPTTAKATLARGSRHGHFNPMQE